MPRRVTIYRNKREGNTLWNYLDYIPLRKIVRNFLLLWVARRSFSMPFKNRLYRAMGAKIGKGVAFGLEATMELLYPELVEIGDNSVIGYNVTILTHEMLVDHWRLGKVQIGKNCVIGANTTIMPGVRIADNTIVSAHSLVNKDVSGFVGGVPTRPLKRGIE